MTDTTPSYPSSPEMPHRVPPETVYYNAPKSIIGAAGEGFRLSLELQLVGQQPVLQEGLASADIEIQMIIKKISEFSLMLKQVGKIMDESRTIASPNAIKTASDIKTQSQRDFDEIKHMIELQQKHDEQGRWCGIEVAEQVTRSFKKRRMQYLMGQLEYLKDSLAIMLQTLELGKEIASAHEGTKRAPSWKVMRQERAEIQNMIVVQHWSFLELQKLYKLAEKEAIVEIDSSRQESPPPAYDAANPSSPNTTMTITVGSPQAPPKEVEQAKTLVPFSGERSLEIMKTSMEQASAREEEALSAKVNDIVDHLLDEWTEVGNENRYGHRRQIQPRMQSGRKRSSTRKAYVESDESDTSDSDTEYERSENIGGFYLEGPRNAVKKNVRFNPRVDDDIDEDDVRPRRTTKKHTLGTVDEFSSDTDSSSDDYSSQSPVVPQRVPPQHRGSNSSSGSHRPSLAPPSDRSRRPYGGPPSGASQENLPPRPSSRGMQPPPPQSTPARPVPIHGQTWNGHPGYLRPPPQTSRIPSGGPSPYGSYNAANQSPSASPVSSSAGFFPRDPNYYNNNRGPIPAGPPPLPGQSGGPLPPLSQSPVAQHIPIPTSTDRDRQQRRRDKPPRHHRSDTQQRREEARAEAQQRREEARKKDENSASRNIKKGIFGGTAIAGIMELLQGLDGL